MHRATEQIERVSRANVHAAARQRWSCIRLLAQIAHCRDGPFAARAQYQVTFPSPLIKSHLVVTRHGEGGVLPGAHKQHRPVFSTPPVAGSNVVTIPPVFTVYMHSLVQQRGGDVGVGPGVFCANEYCCASGRLHRPA